MGRLLLTWEHMQINQSQKLCSSTLGVFLSLGIGSNVPERAEEVEMNPSRRCYVSLPAIALVPHCQR